MDAPHARTPRLDPLGDTLTARVLAPLWSAGGVWWLLFGLAAAGTVLLGIGVG